MILIQTRILNIWYQIWFICIDLDISFDLFIFDWISVISLRNNMALSDWMVLLNTFRYVWVTAIEIELLAYNTRLISLFGLDMWNCHICLNIVWWSSVVDNVLMDLFDIRELVLVSCKYFLDFVFHIIVFMHFPFQFCQFVFQMVKMNSIINLCEDELIIEL